MQEASANAEAFDEGLSGDQSALVPAILFAAAALAVGMLAWFIGKKWKHWPMWLLGTPAVLVLVWFSYVYLDRYLPSI